MHSVVAQITLVLLLFVLSCGKKNEQEKKKAPVPPVTSPPMGVNNTPPVMAAKPVNKTVKPKAPVKDGAWIAAKSNAVNTCILTVVKKIRALGGAKTTSSDTVKAIVAEDQLCRKTLLATVALMPDISTPYKKYFILAATVLDTTGATLAALMKTPPPARAARARLEKTLEDVYNTFALQNNDLQGAPHLNPASEKSGSAMDLQTYGDELARYGEVVWNNLNPWYLNHTLAAGVRPSFAGSLMRERVALLFVTQNLERFRLAFGALTCVRGFTRTAPGTAPAMPAMGTAGKVPVGGVKTAAQKKPSALTCEVLAQKAKSLTHAAGAFTLFWKTTLTLFSEGTITVSPVLEKSAGALHESIKKAVMALPPKIR